MQPALAVLAVAIAIGAAFLPREKGPIELAALTAAVLVAFQLSLTHWFYLYLPWFLPFVLLWLLLPREPDQETGCAAARSPWPCPTRSRSRSRRPRPVRRPEAVWKRTGRPVRMRRIASSASTPMTESCGPVMPASVMNAVPREDARVGCLHMRVRSDHCRDSPVEPAGERDLLARRFRVDVDEDERCL